MTNLDVIFRPEQQQLFDERARFAVRVCHRRFGKSWMAVAELLIGALTSKRTDHRAYFIAPSYKQAKRLIWDYVKSFSVDIPGVTMNEAELRIDYPNGSRIQLLGAEQYDSLRGLYADAVVLDEAQLIPTAAWSKVVRPMLADRKGRAILQGTPSGRHNLLFDLHEYAKAGDPDWSVHVMPVTKTDIIDAAELAAMQREMTDAEYQQELHCSFNAAIRGAYFATEMQAATDRGQVTSVKYDAAAPLYVAMDLGWSDLMVAHFVQTVGTEHHFIMTKAYAQTKIADVCQDLLKVGYPIDKIVLPHDAKQHELTSGTTREDTFRQLGFTTVIAPRVKSKHEGIEQTRALLPHCWWDSEGCKTTVEALFGYRSEFDEVKRVARMTPVHDWSSHYVDAVQTYATGRPRSTNYGPLPSSVLLPGSHQPSLHGYSRRSA